VIVVSVREGRIGVMPAELASAFGRAASTAARAGVVPCGIRNRLKFQPFPGVI
jgi:hypothetical protein